jgi:hypothetical protein
MNLVKTQQYNDAVFDAIAAFKNTCPPELITHVTTWWLILSERLSSLVTTLPPARVKDLILDGTHTLILTWVKPVVRGFNAAEYNKLIAIFDVQGLTLQRKHGTETDDLTLGHTYVHMGVNSIFTPSAVIYSLSNIMFREFMR